MSHRARAVVLGIFALLPAPDIAGAQPPEKPTFVEYLRKSAVPRDVIAGFLRGPSWARFDPELGYVLGNFLPTDGIDGSATISTIRPDGARTSFMYAGRPCRINTYGDSFTQCHQVSDGETWQEYLAAHLVSRSAISAWAATGPTRRTAGWPVKSGPTTGRST
jgi:hypothetical protein